MHRLTLNTPLIPTQGGEQLLFEDADRALYLELLREGLREAVVRCLAWCLMDNHVHLILVPEGGDGLRVGLYNISGAVYQTNASNTNGNCTSLRKRDGTVRSYRDDALDRVITRIVSQPVDIN